MMRHPVAEWGEHGCLYQRALQSLVDHGARPDRQLASAGLILWVQRHPRTAGRNCEAGVTWGERYPCIVQTAQELNVGSLHFLSVDMGFLVTLSSTIRMALGEPEVVGRNQRVCLHVALGLEWTTHGRPKRIPNKTRVLALASQVRSEEYQQGLMFMASYPDPRTPLQGKLRYIAHDILRSHRDRNFQDLNPPCPTMGGTWGYNKCAFSTWIIDVEVCISKFTNSDATTSCLWIRV